MPSSQPAQPRHDPALQWVQSLPAEPRRRRRAWPWLVALVIVVGLALGAWFIGESIARDLVAKTVREQVITQLSLPADQQVDVALDGAVLPQLIGGTLRDITVSSPDVPLGAVVGDVTVHAQGVPIRGDGPAAAASATLRMDADQVETLLATIDGFPSTTVALTAPDIAVSTDVTLFGVGIPVGVSLTPSAADGDVVLTPSALRLAGADVSADDLRQRFGSAAGSVLRDWNVCIAQYIPAGVSLRSVQVTGSQLVAELDIDGAIVSDAALQENGTCG